MLTQLDRKGLMTTDVQPPDLVHALTAHNSQNSNRGRMNVNVYEVLTIVFLALYAHSHSSAQFNVLLLHALSSFIRPWGYVV